MHIYSADSDSTAPDSAANQTSDRPSPPQRPIRRSSLSPVKPELMMPKLKSQEVAPDPVEPDAPQVPKGKALDVGAQMVDPAAAIAKELLTDWRYDC